MSANDLTSQTESTRIDLKAKIKLLRERHKKLERVGSIICFAVAFFLFSDFVLEFFRSLLSSSIIFPAIEKVLPSNSSSGDPGFGPVSDALSSFVNGFFRPGIIVIGVAMIMIAPLRMIARAADSDDAFNPIALAAPLCLLFGAGILLPSIFPENSERECLQKFTCPTTLEKYYPKGSYERTFIDAQWNAKLAKKDPKALEYLKVELNQLKAGIFGKKLLIDNPEVSERLEKAIAGPSPHGFAWKISMALAGLMGCLGIGVTLLSKVWRIRTDRLEKDLSSLFIPGRTAESDFVQMIAGASPTRPHDFSSYLANSNE